MIDAKVAKRRYHSVRTKKLSVTATDSYVELSISDTVALGNGNGRYIIIG